MDAPRRYVSVIVPPLRTTLILVKSAAPRTAGLSRAAVDQGRPKAPVPTDRPAHAPARSLGDVVGVSRLRTMLDRFTVIRSVDCRGSNHEPNMVMQTANRAAEPRTNPKAKNYPAIGS